MRLGSTVRIYSYVDGSGAECQGCGSRSERVHSRYQRRLSDTAMGGAGRETLICLQMRRFFCDNKDCARKTFAEQVPGLTAAYARRTPLLRGMLEQIALAVGGRPGERLTRRLAVVVSR